MAWDEKECDYCGNINKGEVFRCENCQVEYCTQCTSGQKICPSCGSDQIEQS